MHKETEAQNIIFQHYAYTLEKQLRFKEVYYGYRNAVEQWKELQRESSFPVALNNYFTWVKTPPRLILPNRKTFTLLLNGVLVDNGTLKT